MLHSEMQHVHVSNLISTQPFSTLFARLPPHDCRICNPPLNPLSWNVRVRILESLLQAQANPAIRFIVITGGDNNAFSAGADIKEMADGSAVRREPDLLAVVDAIEACEKPVIAVIGGVALGGGCEVRWFLKICLKTPENWLYFLSPSAFDILN